MAEPAAPAAEIPAAIAALSFEDALRELEAIVRQMEEGRGRLDEAIANYERGTALRRHCEARLSEAQAKVELISQSTDGQPQTQPFTPATATA